MDDGFAVEQHVRIGLGWEIYIYTSSVGTRRVFINVLSALFRFSTKK